MFTAKQDKDIAYWRINYLEIEKSALEYGIEIVRNPVVDFDGDSLRDQIPSAVCKLYKALKNGGQWAMSAYMLPFILLT